MSVLKKTWRDSIIRVGSPDDKPVSSWRQTIVPEILPPKDGKNGKDGKDFNFEEHREFFESLRLKFSDLTPKQINSLKLKFSDLTSKEREMLRGKPGQDGKQGRTGVGFNGASAYDIAKRNGFVGTEAAWIASLSGGGGGGTATNIVSTAIDLQITTETHVVVTGVIARTMTLKNVATATEPVVIKNKSTANVTVNVDGGANIDDDTSLIIVPGNSFSFFPEGAQYYVF